MTIITLSETGTLQLPPNIMQLFGLTKGTKFDVITSKKGITLLPKTNELSENEKQALIEQQINEAFGMVKVNMPNGFNLMDFEVADHVPLFDAD